MKIMVFGSSGQLGKCLEDHLVNSNHELSLLDKNEGNITDFQSIKKKIEIFRPNVIINSGAYTNVDKAESEKEKAFSINSTGPRNIAKLCFKYKCLLIHISTDFVFDGNTSRPYRENDITNPINNYGKSKLSGENEIISSGCSFLILRTSWVYSEYGSNFLKTILKNSLKNSELKIVDDQIGCPTYAQDIAKSILKILKKVNISDLSNYKDIYNFCGDVECTWFEFTKIIFQEALMLDIEMPKLIHPIKTKDFKRAAQVPAYSALDCTKIKETFSINRSNLKLGVKCCVHKFHETIKHT